MSDRERASRASIKARTITNSTVIGIREGPSTDDVQAALREELKPLLALVPSFAEHLRSVDPIAESLFVCRSTDASTIGFAVNNSGLIVCPTAVGVVTHVTEVRSGETHLAETGERKRMLQAVSIAATTRGLVPAYRREPEFDEELFAWDDQGVQRRVTLDAIAVTGIMVGGPGDGFMLTDGLMARFDPRHKLVGGPVMTATGEVIGIAVGATVRGYLIVEPWGTLDRCIDMDVTPWPARNSNANDG